MKIDIELVKNKAKSNFLKGYNCSQSVVLAYADYLNIDKDTLAKLSSTFGGGICRLRETCGAISGMMVVLGLLMGYSTPETGEVKAELYKKGQDVALEFEKQHKTLICRELLNKKGHDLPTPEARNENFYKTRPCLNLIISAAEILGNYINENL